MHNLIIGSPVYSPISWLLRMLIEEIRRRIRGDAIYFSVDDARMTKRIRLQKKWVPYLMTEAPIVLTTMTNSYVPFPYGIISGVTLPGNLKWSQSYPTWAVDEISIPVIKRKWKDIIPGNIGLMIPPSVLVQLFNEQSKTTGTISLRSIENEDRNSLRRQVIAHCFVQWATAKELYGQNQLKSDWRLEMDKPLRLLWPTIWHSRACVTTPALWLWV